MNSLISRKKVAWPDPESSIGRVVNTGTKKMAGHQAWFPQGTALELYEGKVLPDLKTLLEHTEFPNRAPAFLRLYMIGQVPQKARPMVMVCCVDRRMRQKMKDLIQEAGILEKYPGFGLGDCDIFLEVPAQPPRMCAGHLASDSIDLANNGNGDLDGSRLTFTTHMQREPWYMGKQLTIRHPRAKHAQVATLGPIVSIGDAAYHLTAWHPFADTEQDEDMDYGSVNFGHDDDDVDSMSLHDITSRGSLSPVEVRSSSGGESPEDSTSELQSVSQASASAPIVQSLDGAPASTRKPPLGTSQSPNWPHIYSQELDYALVPAPNVNIFSNDWDNSFVASMAGLSSPSKKTVRSTAKVPAKETPVVVVTGSSGQTKGTLMPGTISSICSGSSSIEKMYFVLLDGLVWQGDSGSAVIDADTGVLYGHIVMACPGSASAYIVSASDVFNDIKSQSSCLATFDLSLSLARASSRTASHASRKPTEGSLDTHKTLNLQNKAVGGAGMKRSRSTSLSRDNQVSSLCDESTGEPKAKRSRSASPLGNPLKQERVSHTPISIAPPTLVPLAGSGGIMSSGRDALRSHDFTFLGMAQLDSDGNYPEINGSGFLAPSYVYSLDELEEPISELDSVVSRSLSNNSRKSLASTNATSIPGDDFDLLLGMTPVLPRPSLYSSHNPPLHPLDFTSTMERSASNHSNQSRNQFRAKQAFANYIANSMANAILPKPSPAASGLESPTEDKQKTQVGVQTQRYMRPKHNKVKCTQCDEHPDGFRGEHELQRHMEAKHKIVVRKWICQDPTERGITTNLTPIATLDKCKSCSSRKQYGAYYNAAAHLRRCHFPKRPPRKNLDVEKRRGVQSGGDWPPMAELKLWMTEVHVGGDEPQARNASTEHLDTYENTEGVPRDKPMASFGTTDDAEMARFNSDANFPETDGMVLF